MHHTLLDAAPRPRPTRLIPLAGDHLRRIQRARSKLHVAMALSGTPGDVLDIMEMADSLLKVAEVEASSMLGILSAGSVR